MTADSVSGLTLFLPVPVSQRSDDQPRCVAQVLVGVEELSITDVGQTVFLCVVPSMPELRQPHEGLRAVHLETGTMINNNKRYFIQIIQQ